LAVKFGSSLRKVCERLHQATLCFEDLVKHGLVLKIVAVQYSS
jgi:hypothetical protein